MAVTTQVRIDALQRAADSLGGADALAEQLGEEPRRVRLWLKGVLPIPDPLFLRIADVLAERELVALGLQSAASAEGGQSHR